jgi:hypothetical protein
MDKNKVIRCCADIYCKEPSALLNHTKGYWVHLDYQQNKGGLFLEIDHQNFFSAEITIFCLNLPHWV